MSEEPSSQRERRERCSASRDTYHLCLDTASSPETSSLRQPDQSVCARERTEYHDSCKRSVIEYFDTLRIKQKQSSKFQGLKQEEIKANAKRF